MRRAPRDAGRADRDHARERDAAARRRPAAAVAARRAPTHVAAGRHGALQQRTRRGRRRRDARAGDRRRACRAGALSRERCRGGFRAGEALRARAAEAAGPPDGYAARRRRCGPARRRGAHRRDLYDADAASQPDRAARDDGALGPDAHAARCDTGRVGREHGGGRGLRHRAGPRARDFTVPRRRLRLQGNRRGRTCRCARWPRSRSGARFVSR